MDNEGLGARGGSGPSPAIDGADAWGLFLALVRFVVTLPAAAVLQRLEDELYYGEWHLAWRRNGAWLGLYAVGVAAWVRVDPASVRDRTVVLNHATMTADLLRLTTAAAGARAVALRELRRHVDAADRARCDLVRVRAGGRDATVSTDELAAVVEAAEALGEPEGPVLARVDVQSIEGGSEAVTLVLDGGQWAFSVESTDEEDIGADEPRWEVTLEAEADARPGPVPTFPRERWVALRERAGAV